jgi:hypothetical protein
MFYYYDSCNSKFIVSPVMTPDTIHLLTALVGLFQTLANWFIEIRTRITPTHVIVLGHDITDSLLTAGWRPPEPAE